MRIRNKGIPLSDVINALVFSVTNKPALKNNTRKCFSGNASRGLTVTHFDKTYIGRCLKILGYPISWNNCPPFAAARGNFRMFQVPQDFWLCHDFFWLPEIQMISVPSFFNVFISKFYRFNYEITAIIYLCILVFIILKIITCSEWILWYWIRKDW